MPGVSIKDHPLWDEFVSRTCNLTGYYEDDSFVYLAEEAHRSNGALTRIDKGKLVEFLDGVQEQPPQTSDDEPDPWDPLFEDDELMSDIDRIWLS